MKLLNKIILGAFASWKSDQSQICQKGSMAPRLLVRVFCILAGFLSSTSLAQIVYVGNPLSSSGSPDGDPPLVILGEYSPAGPSATSTPGAVLQSGVVKDVKFYGSSYAFTLYALSRVGNGPNPGEQTFKVVTEESFTNNSALTAVTNTLTVTNFTILAGDFLAFEGTGPNYLQPATTNGLDATYSTNSSYYTALPPGEPGTTFTVGTNGDTNALYQYIPSGLTLPSRTYAFGVDVLVTNGCYTFITIAGQTNGNNDGLGKSASFSDAQGTAVGSYFDVFVADTGNNSIREINTLATNWLVTTIAGSNGFGSLDGVGTNALFHGPEGIAASSNETVFVADTLNDTIRMLTSSNKNWVVSTIAGIAGTTGHNDGTNVAGRFATFDGPGGICVDINTNVFVADITNDTIRKITRVNTNWVVATIAGLAGSPGNADGTNGGARFDLPDGIAVDVADNLYVADSGNNDIRKITPQGPDWVVTTIAGTNTPGSADGASAIARFDNPAGIAVDTSSNLYVSDSGNDIIRKIIPAGTNWAVSTIAGLAGNPGYVDGTGPGARFTNPKGIAVNPVGNLFVDEPTVPLGICTTNTVGLVSLAGNNYCIEVIISPNAATNDGAVWTIPSFPFVRSGQVEWTNITTFTLLCSNITGWIAPSGSFTNLYTNGAVVFNVSYISTNPTLSISKANGLWITGASNATYEIDWTNNWTNGAWQKGKWPVWKMPTVQLSPGPTQVASWSTLMFTDSPATQVLFRAKWTGH